MVLYNPVPTTLKEETAIKISRIDILETDIPLVVPFRTALRTVSSVNDIIVAVHTDTGDTGYGEAPPTAVITGDTKGSIRCAIRDFIAPAITGMNLENMEEIMHALHSCILNNSSAKAAVDMAVYDLYARSLHRPLYQILGGAKHQLETDITISVNPIDVMVQDSLAAVKRGFQILKVKVGKEGMKDVERIAQIRLAAGTVIAIRVDANQGWTPKEAVRIITRMEDLGLDIELVEQPVPAHDLYGMQYVTAHSSTPVLADESVFTPGDAIQLLEMHGADMLNIKLMKTAGIYQALKICSIAEIYGVACMMGCMLESKLAVSAAAHLAAGKNVITKVDLDGPALCRTDPFEGGPQFDGPHIRMNQTDGIGITYSPVSYKGLS